MEQKLNDLRYGVKLYAALGLTFDKADSTDTDGEGAGMVSASQMSKADPTREFMFKIRVNDSDEYELLEPSQPSHLQCPQMYLERLNRDNNIGRFVCHAGRPSRLLLKFHSGVEFCKCSV